MLIKWILLSNKFFFIESLLQRGLKIKLVFGVVKIKSMY